MKRILIVILAGLMVFGMASGKGKDRKKPKNLKILNFETVDETKKYMRTMAKEIGVKCKFCHNLDDFALDTDKKKATRYMMKMTRSINEEFFTWEEARQISCWTCHQGKKQPPEKK